LGENPLATACKFRSGGLGGGGDERGFCIKVSEPSKMKFQDSNVIDVPTTFIIKSRSSNDFLCILCKSEFVKK